MSLDNNLLSSGEPYASSKSISLVLKLKGSFTCDVREQRLEPRAESIILEF